MLNKIWHSGDQHIFFGKKFEAHEYVFNNFYKLMKAPFVYDGRNCYLLEDAKKLSECNRIRKNFT